MSGKTHSVIGHVIKRELQLAWRFPQEIFNALLFFVIVIALFPFAITPNAQVLQTLAPGIIWVAALLSTLLSLDRLFRDDYSDGSLEQFILSPYPLPLFVLAKVISHWLLTGLPLILITPVLALMLALPAAAIQALLLSLLLGTPVLSLLGAIGTGLTVGLRNSGILLTLLILPLYIPVLIFGTTCVTAAQNGLAYQGFLALLGALFILALTLTPFATAAALSICVKN